MNFGTTRMRGRPRNRWQEEVGEDGRIVGGEEWQEKVHNREERKKLLRTARNRRILHMPMEWNRIYCKIHISLRLTQMNLFFVMPLNYWLRNKICPSYTIKDIATNVS
jgi:hypothetical protein